MGEFACMDDAIDNIEADVHTMYLYKFSKETSEEEKFEKLAEMFNLSVDEVEKIITTILKRREARKKREQR